jgi:N-acetylglucosamine-6-phosphate deacetylase
MVFQGGTVVLPDRLVENVRVRIEGQRIAEIGERARAAHAQIIDLAGGYLTPGFVELHVHGGAGSDFMDGTVDSFQTVCRAHARHGTTSLLPTTTVARHDQHLAFFELCRRFKRETTGGARVLGAHFYGPYFNYDARGAHPGAHVRNPEPSEYEQYLEYADCLTTATVAPELPGAEGFVRACRARGIHCNAGHTFATFHARRGHGSDAVF